MPTVDFSFEVWNKYWPVDKKLDAVLIQAAGEILAAGTITFQTVIIQKLSNPERILVTIRKANKVLTSLDHNQICDKLGLPH